VRSFGPYTDAIQDWITQHDIVPEADKKAKELLTHFEIHKLDIFQRKRTDRRAGLLLTEAGAQEVGKGRTSAARRHRSGQIVGLITIRPIKELPGQHSHPIPRVTLGLKS
jgi:hypothetical protein